MVSKPRAVAQRTRDPVRTKHSLLTAGIHLFATHGYHGVAVDEIVAAARCNKRMLYHSFGDKEGLYAAVLQAVYARLEKVEMQPMTEDAATAAVIREIMARYFDFLSRDPEFVNLLLWENLNQGRVLARHPHLLILMIGMCFIYFSNRHTLRQGIGLDIDRPSVRAEGLRTAQRMFLASLGLDGRTSGQTRRAARRRS